MEHTEWVETELFPRYQSAVEACLEGASADTETSLRELGRDAATQGLSAVDLAAVHHCTLVELGPRIAAPQAISGTAVAEVSFDLIRNALEPLLQGYEDARAERQQAQLESLRKRVGAEKDERKLTELALRESEGRFRVLFERAGLGIALLDKLGRIRESNPALQRILGYSAEELHGKTVFDMTLPEDLEATRHQYQQLVEGRCKDYKFEKRFIGNAGRVVWVRKTVSGVFGAKGELQFAIDLIEDITEHRLSEEALAESEARFRQVVDMAGEWIWEQDEAGHYIYSSSVVEDILGYRPEEIIGRPYHELFTAEDRARITPAVPSMISRKEGFHRIVNRYRHKNGHAVYTESTGAPILDRDGNLLKWRGVDRDITERKRFEDALRLRDRAIESSSVGIIITDAHQPGGPIIYANPAFIAMTGYQREEIMGRNASFLQGPDTDPQAIEQIHSALQRGTGCHLTLKNYRKDGSSFWNELLISPVRDERGKLTHFIGSQTDVTALRRVEEERHEMEIAKQIQLSLLPSTPLAAAGILVAGYCLPATHVGGDYFDYFSSENAVDVVIADVSGHSVAAAMIMAEARSTLKTETNRMLQDKTSPGNGAAAILSNMNRLLFEDLNRSDRFITMFYAKYDAVTRELTYANAGHNCPLLLRRRGLACTELDAEGLILGVKQETYFEERKLRLEMGDTLLFYTDGVTEAEDKRGDFFGAHRLRELFVRHADASNQEIIDAVLAELQRFCQSKSFSDDISLVVLKVA